MNNNQNELHPLLRRAIMFLEEGEWGTADDYCERVLDQEPENAYAYVVKLMARVRVAREEDLAGATRSYRGWNSFENALRFADPALRERLEGYLLTVEEGIKQKELKAIEEEEARKRAERERELAEEERRNEEIYNSACTYQRSKYEEDIKTAINKFRLISGYKDSAERIKFCEEKRIKLKHEAMALREEMLLKEKNKKRKTAIIALMVTLAVVLISSGVIILIGVVVNESHSMQADQLEKDLPGMTFSATYICDTEESNGGGALTLCTKMTEREQTFYFDDADNLRVYTIERYDEEPFIMKDGERQWDRVSEYTDRYSWGDVKISLFGKATVLINGVRYEIELSSNGKPYAIVMDDITYRVD